ncbi:DUF5941 domain-containing protein [Halostreptopolyspora alba]|uniref:DUF5941 domain-containing protein n=1 Tax=Halostreptopolyspora alba TaxID=2487137 RepID=A0A3N0E3C4_9ACTN|nr:hypothetical protein EFW17_19675 [Nocardiopsaceae bacterium YIM 96095]
MATDAPHTPEPRVDVRFLRDDGYLGDGLGRIVAGAVPPLLPMLGGVVVTATLLVAGLGQDSGITLFAPAVALLLSGVASGHPHDGRRDWIVPPILRGTEYVYLLALGHGSEVPGPLVFVLVAAVAVHHRDAVCRTHCGVRPPTRAIRARLGWDGRMLLVALGGVLGWLPFAYGALASYLVVLLVWDAWTSWLAAPVATVTLDSRNELGGVDASTT